MRCVVLALCLFPCLATPGAFAQALSVRLLNTLEPMPGNMIDLYGPVGSPVTDYYGLPPVTQPYALNYRPGPLVEIRATTGAGATQITIPAQTLPLVLQEWGPLSCPGPRPCLLLQDVDPLGESFQLDSFTVMLDEPVPDPEGGCIVVRGGYAQPVTAQRPPGAGTRRLQPLSPPPLPPLTPGAPPLSPVLETYQLPVIQSAEFLPPGVARFEVCGDVPDAQTGHLSYVSRQAGGDWEWEARGTWVISIQDNGYHGQGHSGQARHVSGDDTPGGLLLQVIRGSVGTVPLAVTPVWNAHQEALYLQDPANNPPPRAEAYSVGFAPDPGLASKTMLVFSEPSGLPHTTGQTNTLEVNQPAVLALSYFMREYLDGPASAELPVTGPDGETRDPVRHGGAGQPYELTLELTWTLDVEP